MSAKYQVTNKTLDQSNGNVIVNVDIWDDADPATVFHDKTWAVDVDDAAIAKWVSLRAPVLMGGAAKVAEITVHTDAQDVPEVITDKKQEAVREASAAFQKALQLAQVKALNDSDALDKYNALQAAIVDAAQ